MKIGTFSDYKGYIGTIQYDEENNTYHGVLINTHDLIDYKAYTIDDLYYEFKCAIDDYIGFKEEIYNAKGW